MKGKKGTGGRHAKRSEESRRRANIKLKARRKLLRAIKRREQLALDKRANDEAAKRAQSGVRTMSLDEYLKSNS